MSLNEFTEMKCGQCGERFCLTTETYQSLKRSSAIWHCPWGHQRHFTPGPSEADKLRQERDRLKQNAAYLENQIAHQRAEREAAERRASAARGQVTRLKNRAANGVCPCCNRTFVNLQRHMSTKHPKFTAEEVTPEGATIQ